MPIYALDGRKPAIARRGRYWIAPSAVLIGDVVLARGRRHLVRRGAARRQRAHHRSARAPTSRKASRCTPTPGFRCTVGEDCTIGHNAILHCCTIGDRTLIGMGAIVLNGAQIGRNCLVGAGALVTENKTFPDGSLIVGSPAKVVRALDEATIAALQASADRYVANWRRYARG